MRPMIDHMHITVAGLDRAESFYDKLLPQPTGWRCFHNWSHIK